ncbi:MAG: peptide chain release factor 3 [Flavobacteriaceae bacterium]
MNLNKNINLRRTFGIISHPDAGKTTLTEKLLLYGGAINEAGAVKSNKIKKAATSDFMEIEKQRGISVSTSVLSFNYLDKKINILDTPGHKDFAEDTYRTLTAVDSVIVVIDVAKGVEEQTEKLVKVCKMRKIPIMIFVNKCDREGKDAFDLMDELEKKLGFNLSPITFPIGIGYDYAGIIDLIKSEVQFNDNDKSKYEYKSIINDSSRINDSINKSLKEDLELIDGIYPKFEYNKYLNCEIQPVFFGSALHNSGVNLMLEYFTKYAPPPGKKESKNRIVHSSEEKFTGFIFKIHANMDPKHRDRLSFIKIVSGEFKRNSMYYHVRGKKKIRFSSPNSFFADKKEIVEKSYPGDIIGVHDTGNFKIGDSFSEGEEIEFIGIPSFSPEHFKYIINNDPLKTKQLSKGIKQLIDEGVAQLFTLKLNGRKIIGTVGMLQFDVIKYRLEHEYGAKCSYENVNIKKACWIDTSNSNNEQLKSLINYKSKFIAKDKDNKIVFLADSEFTLINTKHKYEGVIFHEKSEF